MNSMRQSGKVSLVGLLAAVSVVVVVVLLLFSRETPTVAGTRFMVALESHDVDTLTKMSMMKGLSTEEIRKKWDFTVNKAERYYRFAWHIDGATQSSEKTASVRVKMVRDADHPAAYEESQELPMVLDNGEWKVDVRAISREFFNCLPQ